MNTNPLLTKHLFKEKSMLLASELVSKIFSDMKKYYSCNKSEEKQLINFLNG